MTRSHDLTRSQQLARSPGAARPVDGGDASLEVHRLLDEAFAGIVMTAEVQDMKEEIRGNLVARVAELRAGGLSGAEAARRAIDDLGDVRDILGGHESPSGPGPAAGTPGDDLPGLRFRSELQQRVRPRPAFLVRTVVLSAAGLAGLAVPALDATVVDVPLAARLAAVVVVALAAGVITADALRQETTVNRPMSTERAAGYGGAVVLALLGAGTAWQYVAERALGWPVAGAVPLLAAVVVFTYLAGSQTNRHKAWVVHQVALTQSEDRFTQDPAAAARFGIYTAVTLLAVIVAFAALTLTVGWRWSWIAVVAGLAIHMLTLARMLFGPQRPH